MGDVVLMMDPHRTMVSDRGATIQIWYVPNLERSFCALRGIEPVTSSLTDRALAH